MTDRLDEQALINPSGKSLLGRMVALRRRVSRLRASLARQRGIFYGLSRPDFQLAVEAGAVPHFQVLTGRFERAIDEVEHTRDLIVGSFELFSSRAAQQTNELVKVLTFLTAVIGICAAVAGVFGMNFDAAFYANGDTGFYATVAVLIVIIAGTSVWARRRGWM
jgi:magnesium transporter